MDYLDLEIHILAPPVTQVPVMPDPAAMATEAAMQYVPPPPEIPAEVQQVHAVGTQIAAYT